jgi:protein-disulfide isomerase
LMQSGQTTPANCQSPVSAHYELGQWLGVQGTPMIFNMQGQLVMNGYAPANAMLTALETGNYNQR